MTAAKNDTKVREIPVEQLVLSQEEARKTIDQAALEELASSIMLNGVIEALLVRPIESEGFEIVSGQRRWLASKLAAKSTCPCVVRVMSDDEARELRVISNLQREDLEPMEEAVAFGELLRAPGATVESVAAKLGKAAGYVGRRLKLLDAIEPVREALKYGAIEVGHALELARLSERQQQELLESLDVGYDAPDGDDDDDSDDREEDEEGVCRYCFDDEGDVLTDGRTWSNEERTVCSAPGCVADASRGGWLVTRLTVAELRKRIARTELRILGDAPFPLEDEIPPMACSECPKRSSNSQGLFDDILRDTCTDPDCYETKIKVWVKAELQKADVAGKGLVMLYDGHAQDKAGVAKWSVAVGADCASREDAIWVSGRLIGRHVAICRDKNCTEHRKDANADSGQSRGSRSVAAPKQSAAEKAKAEAQRAERQKLLRKVETEQAYRERLWKAVSEAKVPDGVVEQHLVRQVCGRVAVDGGGLVARLLGMPDDSFDYSKREAAMGKVAELPYKTAIRVASLAMVVADTSASEYSVLQGRAPVGLERLARMLGVDVAAVRSGKPSGKAESKPSKPVAKKVAAKKPAKKAAKTAPKKAAKKPAKKPGGKGAR